MTGTSRAAGTTVIGWRTHVGTYPDPPRSQAGPG